MPNDKDKDKEQLSQRDSFRFIHHLIICSKSISIFPSGAAALLTRHYGARDLMCVMQQVELHSTTGIRKYIPSSNPNMSIVRKQKLASPRRSRSKNGQMPLQEGTPLTSSYALSIPPGPTSPLPSSPTAPLHLRRQRVSGSEVLMQLLSGETPLGMSSPIFSPDLSLRFLIAFLLTLSLSECFINVSMRKKKKIWHCVELGL